MFSFLEAIKTRYREKRENFAKNAKKYKETRLLILSFFAFSAPFLRFSRYLALCAVATTATAQTSFQGIGRPATPAEIKAWDIDVRPDFKGLPAGKGSVVQGEKIWEAQCAGCHGAFGESNEVFTPIAGNTTAKDIETGRVAALMLGANTPQRTTLMKLSSLSTLWDYVNRAMPWTAPKSLKPDEVYAVSAYMLNLGNIVPADFILSDQNIREVQNRLPNRNGKTTAHAMWTSTELGGVSKPDVQGSACMKDCKAEPQVASFLPAHARDAHGNLAEQSRGFGASRGADTSKPALIAVSGAQASVASANPAAAPAPAATVYKQNQPVAGTAATQGATNSGASAQLIVAVSAGLKSADVMPTLQKYACVACHGMESKLVGPSFKDIAAKQGKRSDAQAYLAGKIKAGSQGVYGQIPMPAQSLGEAEAARVAQWLVQGGSK